MDEPDGNITKLIESLKHAGSAIICYPLKVDADKAADVTFAALKLCEEMHACIGAAPTLLPADAAEMIAAHGKTASDKNPPLLAHEWIVTFSRIDGHTPHACGNGGCTCHHEFIAPPVPTWAQARSRASNRAREVEVLDKTEPCAADIYIAGFKDAMEAYRSYNKPCDSDDPLDSEDE